MPFKIGDEIIMTDEANDCYSITQEGSTGTVIEVSKDRLLGLRVKFNKLTGPMTDVQNGAYWVDLDHVKHLDDVTANDIKYSKIIRKIKQLDKRFENRKKGNEYAF